MKNKTIFSVFLLQRPDVFNGSFQGCFSTLDEAFESVKKYSIDSMPVTYTILESTVDTKETSRVVNRWYVALGKILKSKFNY